ncbi:MAG: O-antigen ligase family protein [Sphingobacteriia bacterium]
MSAIRKLYLDFYLLVYALYAYFNKGIAYSYLAEMLLVIGLIWVLKDLRKIEIIWNRSMQLLVTFLLISVIYILRGLGKYPLIEVIRDSFMINYAAFVLVLILMKDHVEYLKNGLYRIYALYPVIALISFLLISYVPFFEKFALFSGYPLLLYKYNDMGVHLLITSLLMLNGNIKINKKQAIVNAIIIIYLIMVVSAYNRSGMVAYIAGIVIFYFYTKSSNIKVFLKQNIRYLPLLIIVAVSLYASTKTQENFQGRKVGLSQLQENAVSILSTNTEGTLNDNKIWRLTWWAKIIDDSFSSATNFFFGRGFGMSMASVNEIVTEDDTLRSPHSIHLNLLGRLGYPFFIAWVCWMYLLLVNIFKKTASQYSITLLAILSAFIINASFDVYFEGPMGAFPFWTFVGLFYINEMKEEQPDLLVA